MDLCKIQKNTQLIKVLPRQKLGVIGRRRLRIFSQQKEYINRIRQPNFVLRNQSLKFPNQLVLKKVGYTNKTLSQTQYLLSSQQGKSILEASQSSQHPPKLNNNLTLKKEQETYPHTKTETENKDVKQDRKRDNYVQQQKDYGLYSLREPQQTSQKLQSDDGQYSDYNQQRTQSQLPYQGQQLASELLKQKQSISRSKSTAQHIKQGISSKVKFKCQYKTHFGQNLKVIGNIPELGTWNAQLALDMKWTNGDLWICTLELPQNSVLEYKYVLLGSNNQVLQWQGGNNQILSVGNDYENVEVEDSWDGSYNIVKLNGEPKGTRQQLLSQWSQSISSNIQEYKTEMKRTKVDLFESQEEVRGLRKESIRLKQDLNESKKSKFELERRVRELESNNRRLMADLQKSQTNFKRTLENTQKLLNRIEASSQEQSIVSESKEQDSLDQQTIKKQTQNDPLVQSQGAPNAVLQRLDNSTKHVFRAMESFQQSIMNLGQLSQQQQEQIKEKIQLENLSRHEAENAAEVEELTQQVEEVKEKLDGGVNVDEVKLHNEEEIIKVGVVQEISEPEAKQSKGGGRGQAVSTQNREMENTTSEKESQQSSEHQKLEKNEPSHNEVQALQGDKNSKSTDPDGASNSSQQKMYSQKQSLSSSEDIRLGINNTSQFQQLKDDLPQQQQPQSNVDGSGQISKRNNQNNLYSNQDQAGTIKGDDNDNQEKTQIKQDTKVEEQ